MLLAKPPIPGLWSRSRPCKPLFNDTLWNALKAKNGTNTSQAARLDNERAVLAAKHQRTIEQTIEALAEPVGQAIATLSDQTRAMEEDARRAWRLAAWPDTAYRPAGIA